MVNYEHNYLRDYYRYCADVTRLARRRIAELPSRRVAESPSRRAAESPPLPRYGLIDRSSRLIGLRGCCVTVVLVVVVSPNSKHQPGGLSCLCRLVSFGRSTSVYTNNLMDGWWLFELERALT